MNVGKNLAKAKAQAQANADRAGEPRWLHWYGSAYWISKTPVRTSDAERFDPRPSKRQHARKRQTSEAELVGDVAAAHEFVDRLKHGNRTKKSPAQLEREIAEVLAKPKTARSHATMKTDRLHEAQLYWDDQDPKNEGWWLRYRDARGVEQGTAIEGDEDATTEELAAAVEKESHWLPGNGKIKVFRGEQPRGSVTLTDGKVSDWRAH